MRDIVAIAIVITFLVWYLTSRTPPPSWTADSFPYEPSANMGDNRLPPTTFVDAKTACAMRGCSNTR
uniref:Uncharacterized protein n=1 Tax=viral metagenome TaxID=1070528 RepID=A0A6C0E7L6_9ZZZZ